MLSKLISWIRRRHRRSLIYISIIVVVLDAVFILINYQTSKSALFKSLNTQAVEQQQEFSLTIRMSYRNMMQMALYISQNEELNQLFLKGKKTIETHEYNHKHPDAIAARQALLNKIKPAWDQLTNAFDIRQLHYHLGPTTTSFLRVHKPQKFGDNLEKIRPIIVDTNRDLQPRSGFETGRIYSGLRGVYPIMTKDPETQKMAHVGALEAGTSLKQILPIYSKFFKTEVAVLLSRRYVENNMWPEFIKEYFSKNPDINFYIEATSSNKIKPILKQLKITDSYQTNAVQLIQFNDKIWATYFFPFYDYQSTKLHTKKPAGVVIIWDDVTTQLHRFKQTILINVVFSLFGLVIIEAALIWFLGREEKLKTAQEEATTDALTGIFNRRRFDSMITLETMRANQSGAPLSLVMCDIDYFKLYNDTFGHDQGDACLKKVSSAIKQITKRVTDDLIRYGGEEFIVLLPNTSLDSAIKIANKIRKAVLSLQLPNPKSPVLPNVTVSLGVACTNEKLTSLFKAADERLYEAKNRGRNQVYPSI